MYYSNIKKWDIADGAGVRVTLFVSGCTNRCPGCFQPETWDFHYGQPFTQETLEEILQALEPEFIRGLTYEEDLRPGGRCHCDVTDELLAMVDVLVDGRFVQEKKNLTLSFRGSENQRVIDMPSTLQTGRVVLSEWNG